ncbi:MAG: ribonuclease H-like domain-containing protein [Planctomycetaceae bacterium]|nr:ribonuclease H-like domain-containing protein [Planctomycetaceae bacterium]
MVALAEDSFGLEAEEVEATEVSASAATTKKRPAPVAPVYPSPSQLKGRVVYFDIETVPDEERMGLFGLEPLPPVREDTPVDACPDVDGLLGQSIDNIRQRLETAWPCDEWLTSLETAESLAAKPRAGVFQAIKGFKEKKISVAEAANERRKILSVTPEYCKVVALGFAVGDLPVQSMVVGNEPGEGSSESDLLMLFWQIAKDAKRLCGFNVLNFDLPVLFVRSAILDVAASKLIDLKPWGGDVVDLMAARFSKSKAMKLKDLARLMGIKVPAGDVEGSKVFELWRDDPAALSDYVKSDVEVTRQLHRKYAGYFCGG